MYWVALFVFGLCVGALSGTLGIGGGVLLVPGLMLLFGLSQTEAQGTSLAVLSMPVLALAAIVYYGYGYVRLPIAGTVAAGFLIGAVLGAKVIPHVPIGALRYLLGGLLLYVGWLMVFNVRDRPTQAVLPTIVAWVTAYLFRRRPVVRLPEEPSSHTEYHI